MTKESKKDSKYMEASDEIKAEMKKLREDPEKWKRQEEKQEEKGSKKESKDPVKDKIAELTDDLKRVQAEFENYKKRCEKENQNFRDYAKVQLVKKFLTVLDSFEMAFQNTGNHEEFMKGVELIYSQFYNILKDEGLQPIEVKEGQKLDTYYHEVMLSEKSDREEGIILEELQKGYKLGTNILRHSKVKVAKK